MISATVFLLLFGLVVFGPKKTIECAQSIGSVLAQLKTAASQLHETGLNAAANQTATKQPAAGELPRPRSDFPNILVGNPLAELLQANDYSGPEESVGKLVIDRESVIDKEKEAAKAAS